LLKLLAKPRYHCRSGRLRLTVLDVVVRQSTIEWVKFWEKIGRTVPQFYSLTQFSDTALHGFNLLLRKTALFFVNSEFCLYEDIIRMNLLTPALVQRAFQIKYGYPTELSADEIYQEFEMRYNLALDMRQSPESDLSWTKILEGVSLIEDPGQTETERERRRSAIKRLAVAAGYNPVELDLLAEEYLARLEVRWIQEAR